jgi:multiple sugar transport system permease protein
MALMARSQWQSRSRNPIVVEDRRAGWVFVAPAMLVFGIFVFGAMLFALYVSFHDYALIDRGGVGPLFTDPGNTWVGLDNYRHILRNDEFWNAFRNTAWYAAGVVPAQTVTGLTLAVLANQAIRGRTFFRTAFYFPSISSSVVISIIFLWMYSARGPINYVLTELGFSTPRPVWLANPTGVIEAGLNNLGIENVPTWLEGPSVAMLSIMLLNIWTTTGTMMVVYLAGLQNIPGEVYEAAALDGASRFRAFRDVTVPLLRPITAFVVTIGLIGTFQVFDQIWIMSEGNNGGPFGTTRTLAFLIYLEGFRQGRGFGYACALAIVLFLIIMCLYFLQRRIAGEEGR